jgi:integrase/recombinase XerD
MKKRAALSANSVARQAASAVVAAMSVKSEIKNSIDRNDFLHYYDGWQRDCQIDHQSRQTRRNRESVKGLLIWYLDQNHLTRIGPEELRGFLSYLTETRLVVSDSSGEHGRGRWGYDAKERPSTVKPIGPLTTRSYYGILRTMFNWVVEQGYLDISPLAKIKLDPDRSKLDRIQPYRKDQKQALLRAAKTSTSPVRDEAIVKLLLSTGMRANELVMLDCGDIDLLMKRAHIRFAKGHGRGKERTVNFGRKTAHALYNYKAASGKADAPADTPFFTSDRGGGYGQRLTPGGLHQLIARLVERADISGVRRLVHSFRHTFAVDFLKRGGLPNELQRILGHNDPEMTMRYVNFAEGDIEERHIRLDPVDALDKEL